MLVLYDLLPDPWPAVVALVDVHADAASCRRQECRLPAYVAGDRLGA